MIQDYISVEEYNDGIGIVVSTEKASFKTRLELAWDVLFNKHFSFMIKKKNVRPFVDAVLAPYHGRYEWKQSKPKPTKCRECKHFDAYNFECMHSCSPTDTYVWPDAEACSDAETK